MFARHSSHHVSRIMTGMAAQVNGTDGHSVELTNPKGVQLLTSSHIHRAPDHRFGEPEQFLRETNSRCREWQVK